jgi:putative FmdB family regulatory protein
MPVYEYECKACHKGFEYQQRMADPEKTECEACGGALERVISRTAFQLKGGGWYKDLYSSTKTETTSDVPIKPATGSTTGSDSSAAPSAPAASAPAAPATPAASGSSGSSGGGGSSSGGAA